MAYTTDLTDKQYELIIKAVPKLWTAEISVSKKEILNGINYQLKNWCQWRDLPKDFPKWQTVYSQFRRWKNKWIYDELLLELEKLERKNKEKKRNS